MEPLKLPKEITLVKGPDELEALIDEVEKLNKTEQETGLTYGVAFFREMMDIYKKEPSDFNLNCAKSIAGCCAHVLLTLNIEYTKAFERTGKPEYQEKNKAVSAVFLKLAYAGLAHVVDMGCGTEEGIRLIPINPEHFQFGKGVCELKAGSMVSDANLGHVNYATNWSIANDARLHELAYKFFLTLPDKCHQPRKLD